MNVHSIDLRGPVVAAIAHLVGALPDVTAGIRLSPRARPQGLDRRLTPPRGPRPRAPTGTGRRVG